MAGSEAGHDEKEGANARTVLRRAATAGAAAPPQLARPRSFSTASMRVVSAAMYLA